MADIYESSENIPNRMIWTDSHGGAGNYAVARITNGEIYLSCDFLPSIYSTAGSRHPADAACIIYRCDRLENWNSEGNLLQSNESVFEPLAVSAAAARIPYWLISYCFSQRFSSLLHRVH